MASLACPQGPSYPDVVVADSGPADTLVVADASELPDVSDQPDASDLPDTHNDDVSSHDANNDASNNPDASSSDAALPDYHDVHLSRSITAVQPMTGIVLWEDAWNDDAIKTTPGTVQLEYAYQKPSDIVSAQGVYDWSAFDAFLQRIAARHHQAVVRFYYTYPGQATAVPQYIKLRDDYHETSGQSEGEDTDFPDWSNAELQRFHLEFYSAFAERYDDDPRVAFLQVGFGLWGEYHIYDGPNRIGHEFPSHAFQAQFFSHLDSVLQQIPWSISIDAGDEYYSPFTAQAELLNLDFGNFDDSFMCEEHAAYNEDMWTFFGYPQRYIHSPHGGELSYYTNNDQRHALDPAGLYGRTFEELSAKFHISYMMGNDQPDYQTDARIREAGLATGYKFQVVRFRSSPQHSQVGVCNSGIAPIYYPAFVAVNGQRAAQSLHNLLPGYCADFEIEAGGDTPSLSIECDHLVNGQAIEFIADL